MATILATILVRASVGVGLTTWTFEWHGVEIPIPSGDDRCFIPSLNDEVRRYRVTQEWVARMIEAGL
jgi:hypothetical protein